MRRAPLPLVLGVALSFGAALSACPGSGNEQREQEKTPEASTGGAEREPASGEATLLLMADIRGILRPCGCTADLQKGGFDRLKPHLDKEREQHPKLQLVHAGPLFFEEPGGGKHGHGDSAQAGPQAKVAAELVSRIDLAVAGASTQDIIAAKGEYKALVDKASILVTAANLAPDDKWKGQLPTVEPWVVRQIGDLKVGIFALDSPDAEHLEGHAHPVVTDPKEAAKKAVAALKKEADLIVLLSSLGLRNTKRLVRAVEGIHFAVAGGMGDQPSFDPSAELVGGTRVMQFHREGRYIGRLTVRLKKGSTELVDASAPSKAELEALDQRIGALDKAFTAFKAEGKDPKSKDMRSAEHHLAALKTERDRLEKLDAKPPADKSSFSFILTPLNWDLPQDPELLALMDAFDEELKAINLANAGTLPEPEPGQAVYVGAETCLECHSDTEDFWENTRHSHAWETLEKQNKTFDAKCVSCHVTGYGKAGGSILGQTKGREDVQCESCHGPGSLHVDAVDEETAKKTIQLVVPESTCVECHNKHHSPHFDYPSFREKLLVPGHGKPAS